MLTPEALEYCIVIIREYSLLARGIIASLIHVGEWSADQESTEA